VVGYDIEKLRALSPVGRHNLWVNALKQADTNPKAAEIVHLIETSGLDYRREKSLTLDDPISKRMEMVIFSPEGKTAALEATAQGLPALAGIDPLLVDALGKDYGKHNEATAQAGFVLTNMMRQLGYENGGSAPLPKNCVARSGQLFVLKPKSTGN
jgi:hypothetical protein